MKYECIELSIENTVATLELARPDKMNSLNDQILIDMQHALDMLENDAGVRVLIITGQGEPSARASISRRVPSRSRACRTGAAT
jgi:enoyl-CoA hydratase